MEQSEESFIFELSKSQMRKFREWARRYDDIDAGAAGGAFTFCFSPTTLGICVSVKHFNGDTLNLLKEQGV